MKLFFYRDKSGRGETQSDMTRNQITDAFDSDDETTALSWDGQSISEWAKDADVGDRWENAANEITRTK